MPLDPTLAALLEKLPEDKAAFILKLAQEENHETAIECLGAGVHLYRESREGPHYDLPAEVRESLERSSKEVGPAELGHLCMIEMLALDLDDMRDEPGARPRIAAKLRQLADKLAPIEGDDPQKAAYDQGRSGALTIVAHNLVIEKWTMENIEDEIERLRTARYELRWAVEYLSSLAGQELPDDTKDRIRRALEGAQPRPEEVCPEEV